MEKFNLRRQELLNSNDPKYVFCFGPEGFRLGGEEVAQLSVIARAVVAFLTAIVTWYRKNPNHWMTGILRKGYPASYNHVRGSQWADLPLIVMVDTVWTRDGWRVVEVDATNRNAFGYPPLLRSLYQLPPCFGEIQNSFCDCGGVDQIMAEQYRFYEPYYRYFLGLVGGELVREVEVGEGLKKEKWGSLLDLPPLYHIPEFMPALLARVEKARIAIPPYHWMSSKGALALAFEVPELSGEITKFVGATKLLHRRTEIPGGDFFVKTFQGGGAHGTSFNNLEILGRLRQEKKAQAIWQQALPIERRDVAILSASGLTIEQRFIRCSIFIETATGKIVDADVTACHENIVHGGKEAVMTVPVL